VDSLNTNVRVSTKPGQLHVYPNPHTLSLAFVSRSGAAKLGGAVPIQPLLAEVGVFSPEDVTALATAFEDALGALHLDRTNPVALAIAKRIIELAKRGERNPSRLRNAVVSEFEARQR
jgi:hypothetical protein